MSNQASGGENRPPRRLLPGPPKPLLPLSRRIETASRRHRQVVRAACQSCRQQKAKCSGERPSCRRCVQQRIQCRYTTQEGETTSQARRREHHIMQSDLTVYQEVVELLKNLPDQEAQVVLQKVRLGTDMTTIVAHVQAGDVLLQLAVPLETRLRYEFPYRSEMPEDYVANNPYLDSLIYKAASLYSPSQDSNPPRPSIPSLDTEFDYAEYQSLYLKPFHAAHVVDPLLSNAKPSLWTTVCNDDVFMRDLLGVFLRCEYHFTSAFQKDYFFEDMIAQRQDFCSSMLVNIILAYSCICSPQLLNRAEYWNPHTFTYRFLAEAKRIWELEADVARITTIQAGILFSVFHNLCGIDEIGKAYRIKAVALAHELDLFGIAEDEQSKRLRRGRAFLAWTLYSWETLTSFSFMQPPLLRKPPDEPLPDPADDPQWYGELWVKYPLAQSLSSLYFGQVFNAKCEFRIIMNDFCHEAYSIDSKDLRISLDRANEFQSKLQDWYNGLTTTLLPKSIVLPGQLQLHMYYHNFILNIFEPLCDTETNQEPPPRKSVADSTRYLQTLVRLYYIRHGFDAMDLSMVAPLVRSGFTCLDAIVAGKPKAEVEILRSTLILVAHGLYKQRRNHHLAEALFRVLRGRMRPEEVALLRRTLPMDDDKYGKENTLQTVRSAWPVSLVKKEEGLESNILTSLVEHYAHLNIDEPPVTMNGSL